MDERKDMVEFFSLERAPFSKDMAVDALMRSDMFNEAYGRIRHSVDNRLFCILTAPPGCGKSTLLRAVSERLDPKRYEILYVAQSKLTPRWLYNSFLSCLGKRGYYYRGDGQKALQEEFAILAQVKGRQVVCIVDEAHLLGRETIEELRFFLNSRMDSESPVPLILSGQSELVDNLRRSEYEAIRQRIQMTASLSAMDAPLTRRYIACHLSWAGAGDRKIFSDEALELVCSASRGIARTVNNICRQAMVCAALNGTSIVDSTLMGRVIRKEMIL